MKIGILTRENNRQTIDILDIFFGNNRKIDLVIIETAKRRRYSENEILFSANHAKLKKYLLKNDRRFLIKTIFRKLFSQLQRPISVSNYCIRKDIRYSFVDKHSSEKTKNLIIKDQINILLLVESAWLIRDILIEIMDLLIINIHNAILPKHRGLDSLFHSVLNQDPLGLTAHLVDRGIDTGNIIKFFEVERLKNENILEYRERLHSLKPLIFLEIINDFQINNERFEMQKGVDGIHHRPLELNKLIQANHIFNQKY